jgi:hypothetical protein
MTPEQIIDRIVHTAMPNSLGRIAVLATNDYRLVLDLIDDRRYLSVAMSNDLVLKSRGHLGVRVKDCNIHWSRKATPGEPLITSDIRAGRKLVEDGRDHRITGSFLKYLRKNGNL